MMGIKHAKLYDPGDPVPINSDRGTDGQTNDTMP
jgi:hypothetical protein